MGQFRFRPSAAAAAAAAIFALGAVASEAPAVFAVASSAAVAADAGAVARDGTDRSALQEEAGAGGGGRRRRGLLVEEDEFGNFGGYRPTTDVTNWALLDRDQRSLESLLKLGTPESFAAAKNVYLHGGHSFSYAVVDIDPPLADGDLDDGDMERTVSNLVTGRGKKAEGRLVGYYDGGEESVSVLYPVPENRADMRDKNMCMIGGLKGTEDEMTKGCYKETGTILIGDTAYTYEYDMNEDTYGHVTLSGISKMAMREMYRVSDECFGCPYPEFVQYHEYYQDMSYGNRWVQAALDGNAAEYLGRGDADFTEMSLKAREDAVKKGTVYLNVFMYVLKNMRQAVSECGRPCGIVCDVADAVEAWDTAAALYVGSLERRTATDSPAEAEEAERGEFLYDLAESRCRDAKTCGKKGNSEKGTSSVNVRIMKEFAEGQKRIEARACNRAESHLSKIWDLMTIPLIQGALKYAHLMDGKTNPEKADLSSEMAEKRNAEGATFAAAILPRVHACNPDDAEVLYGNMRVGAAYTDFATVKRIFEANYECMGVTCRDVGGVYDKVAGTYFEGAAPCDGTTSRSSAASAAAESEEQKNRAAKIAGGVIGAVVALVGICFGMMCHWENAGVCCLRCFYRKRKEASDDTDVNAESSSEDAEGFSYEGDDKKGIDGMADISII